MTNDFEGPYPTLHEVVAATSESLSSPRLTRSNHVARTMARVITVMFIIAVLALIFTPWVQTVKGSGRVIAYSPNDRAQFIAAPIDGRVDRWHVLEGTKVKKGDPIVDIIDIDPNIMERLKLERDAVKTKLEAAEKSVQMSSRNLDRQKQLVASGLSSQRAYELAELEYAKFLSDLSSTAGELARIETRMARQASQAVTAPIDGVVQRVLAQQGSAVVKAGEQIALIVPDTADRAVELKVRGIDLPLLSVGRQVRLQFEGWPAIQFSGWPSVAHGTFGGTVAVIDPSDDGSGNFRIIIIPDNAQPWPSADYLRQGVRAVGWVLLDSVKLWWELWRQFNGFPPSISSAREGKDQGRTVEDPYGREMKKGAIS